MVRFRVEDAGGEVVAEAGWDTLFDERGVEVAEEEVFRFLRDSSWG